jgi:hypothetical protein
LAFYLNYGAKLRRERPKTHRPSPTAIKRPKEKPRVGTQITLEVIGDYLTPSGELIVGLSEAIKNSGLIPMIHP